MPARHTHFTQGDSRTALPINVGMNEGAGRMTRGALAFVLTLGPIAHTAWAQVPPDTPMGTTGRNTDQDVPYNWLDQAHQALYETIWRSAEYLDRWFGSGEADMQYQSVHGSVAPGLLYTRYDQLRAQARFDVNIPLPQIDERVHSFFGRFDPNEVITEQNEPTGLIPRTYGPAPEDQTLLGIGFHQSLGKEGGGIESAAGVRLGFPMDPYLKGSYVFQWKALETGRFTLRETLFWQRSEGAGETTRLDLDKIPDENWLVRFTISGTKSQQSLGLRGYSSLLVLHSLSSTRAVALGISCDGQTDAPVPLHDYGAKVAYRQNVLRRWLIAEVRASVDWPRDYVTQHRPVSPGVGIGFEILLGTEQFLARPVTF